MTIRNAEIDAHELLDDGQRIMLKAMRRARRSLTMLDFAQVALRATGCNYARADAGLDGSAQVADRAHRRAAVLYVYEALRASDAAIIKEWPEFDEMLRMLVVLVEDLP